MWVLCIRWLLHIWVQVRLLCVRGRLMAASAASSGIARRPLHVLVSSRGQSDFLGHWLLLLLLRRLRMSIGRLLLVVLLLLPLPCRCLLVWQLLAWRVVQQRLLLLVWRLPWPLALHPSRRLLWRLLRAGVAEARGLLHHSRSAACASSGREERSQACRWWLDGRVLPLGRVLLWLLVLLLRVLLLWRRLRNGRLPGRHACIALLPCTRLLHLCVPAQWGRAAAAGGTGGPSGLGRGLQRAGRDPATLRTTTKLAKQQQGLPSRADSD
jgi:hypothetical protein